MKRICLFILFILFLAIPAHAADITLAWDANIETDLAGYRIFQCEKTGNKTTEWVQIGDVLAGTETFTTTVDEKKDWCFYVIAYDTHGNESRASNLAIDEDKTPPDKTKNVRK